MFMGEDFKQWAYECRRYTLNMPKPSNSAMGTIEEEQPVEKENLQKKNNDNHEKYR